jgi:phasin
MNESVNPKAAAEKARETSRKTAAQFEELAYDTPETMRAFAEKSVAHTRELYERSKDALEAVRESWEKSFDAAGQGAMAFNRKVIDIAQRNINSSFDLAKSLAGAKNLAETMELHGAYWRKQLDALATQAEEVRALSAKVTANATEPLKTQVKC